MEKKSTSLSIVVADGDAADRMMAQRALEEAQVDNPLFLVEDGEELLDFLKMRGKYAEPGSAPRPAIILLDLNMPKKDGLETLREIKRDPELYRIPVIVFSHLTSDEDVIATYDLGGNSFVPKPATIEGMVEVVKTLMTYWLQVVILPTPDYW